MSKAEYTTITVNGIGHEKAIYSMWGYNISYSLTLQFKDGKMRIDQPNVIRIQHPNPQATISQLTIKGLFDKNEKVKTEKTKISIELYFNSIIDNILSKMASTQDNSW